MAPGLPSLAEDRSERLLGLLGADERIEQLTAQAEAADPLALASLIGRLEAGPREAAGRTVLVVELTPRDAAASLGENLARTLAERSKGTPDAGATSLGMVARVVAGTLADR